MFAGPLLNRFRNFAPEPIQDRVWSVLPDPPVDVVAVGVMRQSHLAEKCVATNAHVPPLVPVGHEFAEVAA